MGDARLQADRISMLIATGFTNIAYFPLLFISYRRKALFHLYIGMFTFLCSFMYHCQESLSFKLYLSASNWHRLDNVGSIVAWLAVLIHFMDNLDRDEKGGYTSPAVARADYHLIYAGFLSVLITQTKDPWSKSHSLIPILVISLLLLLKVIFIRPPRLDWAYFSLGLPWAAAATYFFIRGLDDRSDYLRMNHGVWHICAGVSIFYLWQSVDKMRPIPGLLITKFEKTDRFGLLPCIAHLLSLGYIPISPPHPPHPPKPRI